jgi:hypothetical protein
MTHEEGVFPLPSLTVAKLEKLRRREEQEERRDRERADGIESGNYSLAGPSLRGGSLPEIDSRFEKRLDGLKQLVGSEQNRLVPVTPPMYRLTAGQRQGIYNGIEFVSELIDRNIIRPEDPEQMKKLRQIEASNHSKTSAASPHIYKPAVPNLRYHTQIPMGWGAMTEVTSDTSGTAGGGRGGDRRMFVTTDSSIGNQHKHSLEDTLILDVRQAMVTSSNPTDPCNRSVTTQPTSAMTKHVHFPYFMLSPDERRSLQLISQHESFLNFSGKLYKESLNPTTAGASFNLGELIKRATNETGLALAFVQFRFDAYTVEIVLRLNVEATFFGVLTTHMIETPTGDTQTVITKVRGELDGVYKKDVVDATVQQPTLGRLRDQKEQRAAMADIEEFRHLSSEYTKSHADLGADKLYGTRVDRLIGRSVPFRVTAALKSAVLCAVRVRFAYAYFGNCQCFIDDGDLDAYKLRYARAAREQRRCAALPHAKPLPAAELLPIYDSDEEVIDSAQRKRKATTHDDNDDNDNDEDIDDKTRIKKKAR